MLHSLRLVQKTFLSSFEKTFFVKKDIAAGFKKQSILDSKSICSPVRLGDNYHKYFIRRFIENIVDICGNEIGAKSF
jgi:hypothetical protein